MLNIVLVSEMSQISIFDGSERFKIDKPIRLIEVFAGVGSQAKALERLNVDFEHYHICEFDKYAVKSYNAIHGTNFETSDVTKITADDLAIVDTDKYCYILTYSFPCQDLSTAGQQKGMSKGSNTRSGLLWEVERLLNECKELPQVLLMENVPQVHAEKNEKDFYLWLNFLERLGYKNYWQDLNAKDYGIPQNRNRTFCVSILGDYFYEFPKPIPLKLRMKDLLEMEVDDKYYISGNILENHKDLCLIDVNKSKISRILRTTGGRSLDFNHNYNVIDCCSLYGVLDCYSYDMANRVYDINGISPTLTNAGGGGNRQTKVITPKSIARALIPLEYWRLMGFDDEDFEKAAKVNSNTQLYKQAGNSIVVNVLEHIFKQML